MVSVCSYVVGGMPFRGCACTQGGINTCLKGRSTKRSWVNFVLHDGCLFGFGIYFCACDGVRSSRRLCDHAVWII